MPFSYDLTRIKTRGQLVNFLGISDDVFQGVLDFKPEKTKSEEDISREIAVIGSLFFRHEIPKKNPLRGKRIVWETFLLKNEYKALSRRLHNFISRQIDEFPHSRAFGYIPGRNIRENAQDHCGHKNLISVDIENFFPSITSDRIAQLLVTTGVEVEVSELISRFVTIEGLLPLGLPTSPIIANSVCLKMDMELAELAQNHNATFSRYADDITFSSNGPLPSEEKIAICLQANGFDLAKSKTRISKLGQSHYVTGLSVSDQKQPHVPRKKKRRLQQELYYAGKFGLDDHFFHLGISDDQLIQQEINRLDGMVKFTTYHEPNMSHLKSEWREILRKSDHSPGFKPKNQDRKPFYIFVDEAEFVRDGDIRILALAMVASQNQDQINQATIEVLEENLSDVWASGKRDQISKNGMHFSDATEDLRLAYIERLRFLQFEGYVAMARMSGPEVYEATYVRLIKSMVKRRLMAAESQNALVVFEKNNKVRQDLIRETVLEAHEFLRKSNNRHPEICYVDFCDKSALGISVPDFLLGALGKYLVSGPENAGTPTSRDVLLFERLRDKYRLIIDIDTWTEYSRRRPITPW